MSVDYSKLGPHQRPISGLHFKKSLLRMSSTKTSKRIALGAKLGSSYTSINQRLRESGELLTLI